MINRRQFLRHTLATGFVTAAPSGVLAQDPLDLLTRPIPSSGEMLPAVGLGSWITFNVGDDPVLRETCADVMEAFFRLGGRMIDSSPMYGSSQATIGFGLEKLDRKDTVFSAEKVWTRDPDQREAQLARTRREWGLASFDLVQVHNLVAWEPHLAALHAMKDQGRPRYVGITTSHGRRHRQFEHIMANEQLDFVQLTYNPVDREAENRLLPLALERGIGVIVNRPFRGGPLAKRLEGRRLPDFAGEIQARTWAQLILKFIVSHPAITCAIPATTQVVHVTENMQAANGPLPDAELREQIAQAVRDS